MGYEMRWTLQVTPPGARLEWPSDSSAPGLTELLGRYGVCWSWYSVEDDMLALSASSPDLLFTLTVHNVDEAGLHPPERWYFKSGRQQKTTATYLWPKMELEPYEDTPPRAKVDDRVTLRVAGHYRRDLEWLMQELGSDTGPATRSSVIKLAIKRLAAERRTGKGR